MIIGLWSGPIVFNLSFLLISWNEKAWKLGRFSSNSSGSRDDAVVRAFVSHQCGPGLTPGLGVICGMSLLLVLVPAPRVFLRVLRFSSLHKNQHFQISIRPGNSGEKSHSVDSTEIPIYSPCLSPDTTLLSSVLLSFLIAHMEEL